MSGIEGNEVEEELKNETSKREPVIGYIFDPLLCISIGSIVVDDPVKCNDWHLQRNS